jgi:hypothetical protein
MRRCPTALPLPPSTTSGTIRGNINGSVQAFGTLIAMLQRLQQKLGIAINIVCHSEGNYMMMLGMNAHPSAPSLILRPGTARRRQYQQRRSAAVIQHTALHRSGHADRDTLATGHDLLFIRRRRAALVKGFSRALPRSVLSKPARPPGAEQLCEPVSRSLRCRLLRDNQRGVIKQIPQVPAGTSAHSSYFNIPQVLQDWAQTLQGTAPAGVINRVPVAGKSNAFTMRFVPPPALGNIREARRSADSGRLRRFDGNARHPERNLGLGF